MTGAELEEIRRFTRELAAKRAVVADGPLLDQCQSHLLALVSYIDESNGAPTLLVKWEKPGEIEVIPAPKPKRSHHKKKVAQ